MADVLEHRLSSWTSRLVEESQAGVIARYGHRLEEELKPEITDSGPNIVMNMA